MAVQAGQIVPIRDRIMLAYQQAGLPIKSLGPAGEPVLVPGQTMSKAQWQQYDTIMSSIDIRPRRVRPIEEIHAELLKADDQADVVLWAVAYWIQQNSDLAASLKLPVAGNAVAIQVPT